MNLVFKWNVEGVAVFQEDVNKENYICQIYGVKEMSKDNNLIKLHGANGIIAIFDYFDVSKKENECTVVSISRSAGGPVSDAGIPIK